MIEVARIDRVARFSINRPEKRNALNSITCRQLVNALDAAESDPAVGAILLRGNGSAFCAGMDLDEVLAADQHELVELHERLFTTIERARKPIVVAVRGAAIAGGMGLAANGHIVVASPESRFALTEIRIGLWPVVVFRAIARAIGERRATELSLTGRTIGADEAVRFGLVTELASDPKTKAFDLAKKLSEFSPVAISGGLDHIARIRGLSWTEGAPIGHQIRAGMMAGEDFAEGVSAFREKRPPEWPSLRPMRLSVTLSEPREFVESLESPTLFGPVVRTVIGAGRNLVLIKLDEPVTHGEEVYTYLVASPRLAGQMTAQEVGRLCGAERLACNFAGVTAEQAEEGLAEDLSGWWGSFTFLGDAGLDS